MARESLPGREVHDPTVLRAVSHPTRNRILTELSASGPLRAADLARILELPANGVSFHLRQLAKYGLVEEDPAAARDKRDRVWRVVDVHGLSVDIEALGSQPGGRAAAGVFLANSAARVHDLVDLAHSNDALPEHLLRFTSEHALKLTKAEAKELRRELLAVMVAWTDRGQARIDARAHDASDDPSQQRSTYLAYLMLQPSPDVAQRARDA